MLALLFCKIESETLQCKPLRAAGECLDVRPILPFEKNGDLSAVLACTQDMNLRHLHDTLLSNFEGKFHDISSEIVKIVTPREP